MTIPTTLSLTGDQHRRLQNFLFPGDNMEAVAIALCGQRPGDRRHRLLIQEIFEIPYEKCSQRSSTQVTWPTELIVPLLEKASAKQLSVVKIHCHPTNFPGFSKTDNEGDSTFLTSVFGWVEAEVFHGSVVMLPGGEMFGRVLHPRTQSFEPLEVINVVGDDLLFWYSKPMVDPIPDFAASHAQIFGEGTFDRLKRLSVAVIGCSGTGSPVAEQLYRLGVGELILVDDDKMEKRNVNRIINSTRTDAEKKKSKVDVLADAIRRADIGTKVIALPKSLWDPEVIKVVAQCDVVFGCMDTVDGRFLLNSLATYYLIPYFDIGIRLEAIPDGPNKGKIRQVCGTIHYLQPGKSSLVSRGLFDMKAVAAAGLYRTNPDMYAVQRKDGYISGVQEHRPAVISVNFLASSIAINELLARIHPFREEPNAYYASVAFSLSSMEFFPEPEEGVCSILAPKVGYGDTAPLLGLLELSIQKEA